MKYKAILFDLDGSLLPMVQEEFTKGYFSRLEKKMAPLGYEAKPLIETVWAGTAAMVKNDGSRSNEAAFWGRFCEIYGEQALRDKQHFDDFYARDFQSVQECCGYAPQAAQAVRQLKAEGYRCILATNPIFPAIATESRLRWAGLAPEDFELLTSYENSHFCKPNPAYYEEILQKQGLDAADCLMVGNDATEDLAAARIGMQVFLLTDCLINKENIPISSIPQGSFPELLDHIHRMAAE